MIKIQEFKEPQHNLISQKFLTPKKLYLPLLGHTGSASIPLVKPKDKVKQGQALAKLSGFISSSLYAPNAGTILDITQWYHPVLKRSQCIIMQCDQEQKQYNLESNVDLNNKEKLLDKIKNSGIVGMGGAAFPTHVKLQPPKEKEIDTLIINGCECEPYLAADYRLMLENSKEIFKGIEILCSLLNPKRIIFAIEENKHAAVKKMNLILNTKKFNLPNLRPVILKTAYPQGGEKQLIDTLTGRKVKSGQLPFNVGCLVHNVATIFAIYEAVYLNKPLIERMVTFCGDALIAPKNLWVKIGTTLRELFDEKILEFKSEPKKIVCGGPMMGISLDNLDYPILKGTSGILFLSEHQKEKEEGPCIKCARCIDNCPMNLLPLEYAKKVKSQEYDTLADLNIKDCIECGCCAYICPAKIPIVHYVKIGKRYMPK